MSKCPLCFTDVGTVEASWQCVNRDCASEATEHPAVKAYLGREMKIKQRRREVRPKDHRGPWTPRLEQHCTKCGAHMERSCLVCQQPIPKDIDTSDVICVALTGARATGKSVSIGVMRLFVEKLVEELRSALTFESRYSQTDESKEYLDQILTGKAYPATPPGIARSLLYSLGQLNGKHRYLAFRDIAGEDLEKSDSSLNLSFLGRADLVIFLFDPLAIRSIRDALESVIPRQGEPGQDPQRVLGTVLGHISNGRPHLAVCLAKVDALQALGEQNSPLSPVFTNAGTTLVREAPKRTIGGPAYDQADGLLLSEEVRSTLMLLNGTSIVNMVENPATKVVLPHRFFATSALGAAADGELLPDHGITPFRVLDPLLWILNEKGVVPSA